MERFNVYQKFLSERSGGEVKNSLILAYFMMIVLFTVFWGILGEPWSVIVPMAIMAWGFGDAAAALFGIRFGKHKLNFPGVDKKKSMEGTLAMIIASALAVFLTAWFYQVFPWYLCLALALAVAPVAAGVELISHNGIDTITVPLSSAVASFLFMIIIRKIGG